MFTGKYAKKSKSEIEAVVAKENATKQFILLALWGVKKLYDLVELLKLDNARLTDIYCENLETEKTEPWIDNADATGNYEHRRRNKEQWASDAFNFFKTGHIFKNSTGRAPSWFEWLEECGLTRPEKSSILAVEDIGKLNIEALRKSVKLDKEETKLYELLMAMPWTMQYNSNYFSLILKNGCVYSLEELKLKGINVSNNTTSMDREAHNTDYAFFSLTPNPVIRSARYGYSTFFMAIEETELCGARDGAWISLHEQVEPYPKNQCLCYPNKKDLVYSDYNRSPENCYRTGEFNIASMKLTYGYPSNDREKTVSVLSEMFSGVDTVEGIALCTIRELRNMGGALYKDALAKADQSNEDTMNFLYSLLGCLWRIEAKFPVVFIIPPRSKWTLYCGDWQDVSPPEEKPKKVVAFVESLNMPPPPPTDNVPPPPTVTKIAVRVAVAPAEDARTLGL